MLKTFTDNTDRLDRYGFDDDFGYDEEDDWREHDLIWYDSLKPQHRVRSIQSAYISAYFYELGECYDYEDRYDNNGERMGMRHAQEECEEWFNLYQNRIKKGKEPSLNLLGKLHACMDYRLDKDCLSDDDWWDR